MSTEPDATTVMKIQELYLLILDLQKRVTALEPAAVARTIPTTVPVAARFQLWQGNPVVVSQSSVPTVERAEHAEDPRQGREGDQEELPRSEPIRDRDFYPSESG
jgi:hypothetical protein